MSNHWKRGYISALRYGSRASATSDEYREGEEAGLRDHHGITPEGKAQFLQGVTAQNQGLTLNRYVTGSPQATWWARGWEWGARIDKGARTAWVGSPAMDEAIEDALDDGEHQESEWLSLEEVEQLKWDGDIRPDYYGAHDEHEVKNCLKSWGLKDKAYVWTAIVYLARLDKKGDEAAAIEDLKKARFWIDEEIRDREGE